MSFVRRGADSAVYIFDHVDLGPVCWNCSLMASGVHHFATSDLGLMLAHVAVHRAAGHPVPDWVDQVLRDGWDAA